MCIFSPMIDNVNTSLSPKMGCEFYSEDGDCLGELEESDVIDRTNFALCSFGYKTDQNGKCRKMISFRG